MNNSCNMGPRIYTRVKIYGPLFLLSLLRDRIPENLIGRIGASEVSVDFAVDILCLSETRINKEKLNSIMSRGNSFLAHTSSKEVYLISNSDVRKLFVSEYADSDKCLLFSPKEGERNGVSHE